MNIAIITAMPEESRAVLKRAGQVEKSIFGGRSAFRCRIAGHDITLVEAGMGMLNAGWAATALAAEAPDLLVSAGFGGGVLPGLKVGDTVTAERLLHWTGRDFEEVETGFCAVDDASAMLRGCFITSDGILDKRQVAESLPSGVNRPVVEMESAAVARVAAGCGIPFLGVRAVSDPWNEELGFSINEFCDEGMRIRPLKVLATILRRPGIIPQLIRLARNSRIAAKRLGAAIERLFQGL
ncbi:MAG: phosphorylase [Deltaproteobacteria bacterium]|nr:phosphorylase [Deltaproteobacteria bacterium]